MAMDEKSKALTMAYMAGVLDRQKTDCNNTSLDS